MNLSRETMKKCDNFMGKLRSLVGLEFESINEIESTININLDLNINLLFDNIITEQGDGPMYKYTGTVSDEIQIVVYINDKGDGGHFISAITTGHISTYVSENIRNIIKGSVN